MPALDIVLAAVGGGGFATVVVKLLQYRAENQRTTAEASKVVAEGGKLSAEAKVVVEDAVQRRYTQLFDNFEQELTRLRDRVTQAEDREQTVRDRLDKAEAREALCNDKLDKANKQVGSLRVEVAHATADAKMARTEIITLQDRLDRLEAGD